MLKTGTRVIVSIPYDEDACAPLKKFNGVETEICKRVWVNGGGSYYELEGIENKGVYYAFTEDCLIEKTEDIL